MKTKKSDSPPDKKFHQSVCADNKLIIQKLFTFSGDKILERIMAHDKPQELVRLMPQEDFFWLIKKMGEDECLPLLKMASDDQKQYLLDMELWIKDRLDFEKASTWLGKMLQADPKNLAKWLFSTGEALSYYYFFKSIQVEVRSDEDDDREFGEDLFTIDGVFYVRVPEEEDKEKIINILREMAGEDFSKYQTLLSTLAGVIPAELEEDMYRLRNVRLAEHGFLPPEEALTIYSPLDPDSMSIEDHGEGPVLSPDKDVFELIPISPFFYARGRNLLTKVFSGINDGSLLDRLRLEFAGLCNQILSADGMVANDLDSLIEVCQKAAGCLNLTLEKICDTDIKKAEILLRNYSLVSLFRVGFGLVLKVKWETERWLKKSWFKRQGLGLNFWPDVWGETLAGIVKNKPQLYVGVDEEKESRAFETLVELEKCRILIHRLVALDELLGRLTESYPLEKNLIEDFQVTVYQLLFNLWARQLLDLEVSFSAISEEQARAFFGYLRAKENACPFRMPGFEDVFVKDFMTNAFDFEHEHEAILKDALSLLWREFTEEYENVSTEDLEGRYSKFIIIAEH